MSEISLASASTDRPPDVFIVGLPRSGTTVLRKWLAQNGGLDCNEIFTEELEKEHSYFAYLHDRCADDPSLILPWRQRAVFDDFIFEMHRKAGPRPLIIDTKYQTLNYVPQRYHPGVRRPYLYTYMRQTEAHMIQLVRRNKLRVIVSEEISRMTGVWGQSRQRARTETFQKPKVRIKAGTVRQVIRRNSDLDKGIEALFNDLPGYHALDYEDLFDATGDFSDAAAEVARTCLPTRLVTRVPHQVKLNPEPLHDLIENFVEVARALEDSPFAWMTEEQDGQLSAAQ